MHKHLDKHSSLQAVNGKSDTMSNPAAIVQNVVPAPRARNMATAPNTQVLVPTPAPNIQNVATAQNTQVLVRTPAPSIQNVATAQNTQVLVPTPAPNPQIVVPAPNPQNGVPAPAPNPHIVVPAPVPNPQNGVPAPKPPKRKRKKGKKKKRPEGMGYGKYVCPSSSCGSKWESTNSSVEVSQECKKCQTPAFPIISPPGKTPYQGARRCFGEYKCTQCLKTWSSGYSWANMGQQCKDCRINIYPHRQRKLLRRKGEINNKHHMIEHCEMCKTMKSSCTGFRNQLKASKELV